MKPTDFKYTSNRLLESDRAIHGWYRFILGYPPHLVRDCLDDFDLTKSSTLLDPFCGTGTTLIAGAARGLNTIGLDANPMTYFASRTKTCWHLEPDAVRRFTKRTLPRCTDNLLVLPQGAAALLIKNSISERPLSKTLALKHAISVEPDHQLRDLGYLALAKVLVQEASNLKFLPNVSVGKLKTDAAVFESWNTAMSVCADDLEASDLLRAAPAPKVALGDARSLDKVPSGINAVITSPPYPCEHDYSQHTRLESVVLGFYTDRPQIQAVKKTMLRSCTRAVYAADCYRRYVADIPEIVELVAEIEARRVELGKTSGFEKLYGKVTEEYFGGMAAHLMNLKTKLAPGAKLAYVVGDQNSYFRVPIRTAAMLGLIAERIGYGNISINKFRERNATATSTMIDENVLKFQHCR
jgi:hypothetical protein